MKGGAERRTAVRSFTAMQSVADLRGRQVCLVIRWCNPLLQQAILLWHELLTGQTGVRGKGQGAGIAVRISIQERRVRHDYGIRGQSHEGRWLLATGKQDAAARCRGSGDDSSRSFALRSRGSCP